MLNEGVLKVASFNITHKKEVIISFNNKYNLYLYINNIYFNY